RLVSLSSDLCLLAEEYHPELHRHLGNFPQASRTSGSSTRRTSSRRSERAERSRIPPRRSSTDRHSCLWLLPCLASGWSQRTVGNQRNGAIHYGASEDAHRGARQGSIRRALPGGAQDLCIAIRR